MGERTEKAYKNQTELPYIPLPRNSVNNLVLFREKGSEGENGLNALNLFDIMKGVQ